MTPRPPVRREFTPLEHVKDAAAHLDFALEDLRTEGAPSEVLTALDLCLISVKYAGGLIEEATPVA